MQKKILEDLTKDCPCKEQWCFLRELASHMGERQAEQIRLIYDYKYMKSKEEGKDIGNERAAKEFIVLYAKRFAEVYYESITHEELFKKVFQSELIPITN